jgi:hypothetical protein
LILDPKGYYPRNIEINIQDVSYGEIISTEVPCDLAMVRTILKTKKVPNIPEWGDNSYYPFIRGFLLFLCQSGNIRIPESVVLNLEKFPSVRNCQSIDECIGFINQFIDSVLVECMEGDKIPGILPSISMIPILQYLFEKMAGLYASARYYCLKRPEYHAAQRCYNEASEYARMLNNFVEARRIVTKRHQLFQLSQQQQRCIIS